MINDKIENIYQLSPLQQGMLFHSLNTPDNGVYFQQLSWVLQGNLNVKAFEQAWQQVVERHSALRTAFMWKRRDKPLQVVYRQVKVPLEVHDWRRLSPVEQEQQLEAFLHSDRQKSFQLSLPPLMRLFLIQVGEDVYQFVWSHHHLLLDGWSLPLIIKEVFAFYEASCTGQNLQIEPDSPYRNYIAWLQKQDLRQAEVFWRQTLFGFRAPTPLTVDRAFTNLENQQSIESSHKIQLTVQMTDALKSFVQQQKLTLSTLLQGAWAILLSRYSGERDVVFGVTVSGRSVDILGVESIVGLLINTLPMRVIVSPDDSPISLLKKIQNQLQEIKQYEYSPLVQVQRWSEVPRGVPLFESLVVFENYPEVAAFWERNFNLHLSNVRGFGRTNYPLTVIAVPGTQLSLRLDYDCHRFDAATIAQMARHFQTLLEAIIAHPQQGVSELPLLEERERHQLLVEWNNTTKEYPFDQCIHQLFEEQVERSPDAMAVVNECEQLTYRELNQRANQIAHHLRTLGVGPEVLVGICVERSLLMVVGLLGILKAGGAYVPLDPAYPFERLLLMLEDAQPSVLLTQERLVAELRSHRAQVICLDSDWEAITHQIQENPNSAVTTRNLAYVIYTSGSTGKPKGVLVTHQNLMQSTYARIFYYSEAVKSFLLLSSFAFDSSVAGIFWTLCSGGILVLPQQNFQQDLLQLTKLIAQNQVSHLLSIPSLYALILEHAQQHLVSLRTVIVAGEPCPTEVIKLHTKQLGHAFLFNEYGPTEATVWSTVYKCQSPQQRTHAPIGRPIANTQIYILDRHLQPVPIGVPGEVHIGGAAVARGYLNDPKLTLEKFIPNPFTKSDEFSVLSSELKEASTQNSKLKTQNFLYKTGDLARYLSDGNIEFLGRIDNQVKVRGFRIELGEIEAVLSQHPGVTENVVIARENVAGDKQLVAYVVPRQEQTPAISDLRGFVKEQLPDYMVPSVFVMLSTLPLTPNGKVDRRALPTPDLRPELQLSFIAPRTPIEEMVASIWVWVLGIKLVGVHDNFFELGGHSLLATQVISRVRDTFAIELSLRSLFEAPTVAELAQQVESSLNSGQSIQAEPLLPIPRSTEIPLSFAQARLWFLDQLQPNSAFYNIPLALRLSGQLNIAALESSLNEIIRRHEALRTNFATAGGQPVQVVASTLNLKLLLVDLLDLPESEREVEAQRLANQEAMLPFNLELEPLVRATLLQLGFAESVLLLTTHHIISDGWSLGVLVRELAELYKAFCTGNAPVLPELPIQYADFAVWQRQWLTPEVLSTQLDYWKQQLKLAPALLEFPASRPRPSVQTFRGAYHSFVLSKELSSSLVTYSKRTGVTLFMTLLAAFQILLYRYTGSDDIIVGTPVANRNRQEIEGLIGFFVNTLVLRTSVSGDPTFEQFLGRVREVALGAYAHLDLPFEQLVEALQPERSLSHMPLLQVIFALNDALVPSMDLLDLTVSSFSVETRTAKFDLTLSMENNSSGLIGTWEYNTDLFDGSTIARMTGHFQTLLEAIVANPQQKVSCLPLLTELERHQLLIEWNNTSTEYPLDKCIHQLFEEQVEQTPNAIAVVFKGEELSYRELNQRANQLAYHLKTLGVEPEVLVGICLERSLEMVVGLLGILKAGGAYVPLDPTYPPERLRYMLEDSSVQLLLTKAWLVEVLPRHKARVVCLDTDARTFAIETKSNPISGVTPDNLAYVIYTSGSTGKPKGTMILHQGVVNYLSWCTKAYAVADGAGAPVQSSIAFDATITSLFSPLLVGQKVVLLPELQEIEALCAALRSKSHFSLVKITPAHLELLNKLLVAEEAKGQTKALVIGGEALMGKSLSFWRTHAPDTRVFNEYGPTETVVGCCVYEVTAQISRSQRILIGRPIANTQIYILDRYLQPVPVGVAGELYIGGDGVARGYFNRPDLTREKFIPNPFSNDPDSRLYKTGDQAHYLTDGNIEFLGRIDNQVKIRGFRIELGEIEAAIAQHRSVRETVVVVREDVPGRKYLAAYIVPNHSCAIASSDLRSFLKEKLPDYMIPGAFVILEVLPLTPNGKVDRQALPAPQTARQELEATNVAPRTKPEEILAKIWREVLHVEQVGIYDNFFELGGDSILSILIISRANQAGLQLTPKQIFQHQTIAELASVAIATPTERAEQGPLSGPLPLTPIQHWFFEQNLPAPHHFNQAFLLEVQQALDPALLKRAVQQLLEHHDALRLRFSQSSEGWQQVNALPDEAVPFSLVDLSALPETASISAMETKAAELQASLNLSITPLVRVALFNLGAHKPSRLLLAIHHLAVDGVSWRILLEDLQTAYQQMEIGSSVQLPPKTTSFKHWAERLTEYARSDVALKELTYWQSISRIQLTRLPLECDEEANTEASARTVSVSLNLEETRALLQEVPKAYHTQINDVLLTTLVQVLAGWSRSSSVLINLEGHGREEILSDVDLSRTVGWFTTIFPVLLELEVADNLGDAIKSIKEQLRGIPNRGIGYGLLRYLSGKAEIADQLQALPAAEVSFNYLGQFDWGMQKHSLFKPAKESVSSLRSPQGHRSHLLDVNGLVVEGQLQLDWTYSSNFHTHDTISGLAQEYIERLRALIAHCLSPEAFGYTPTDFPLATLTQKELDKLSTELSEIDKSRIQDKIEDIYPLSPMQEGMLFHSLYAPENGEYFEQLSWVLQGNLNVKAFDLTWQKVVERHPILRTAFYWSRADKPLQVVCRHVLVPLEILDWRGLSPVEQEQQLAAFLMSDRQKGFQLSLAPLMRLFLIQVGEDTYQFVWSFHHLLLDGWSVPKVVKEVFAFYEAFCQGQNLQLEPIRPYRDYIAWLQRQDLALAEVFWRQTLKGFTAPTPFRVDRASTSLSKEPRYNSQSIQLTVQLTDALKSFASQQKLTLSTLVQGSLALLLSRYSGEADVVFGVTVNGRNFAIKKVESIAGLLINTLPMRVSVFPEESTISWLKKIQNHQVEMTQYEYSPLVQVQGWSEVPHGLPLFESLMVFENYPDAGAQGEQNFNLQISDVRAFERTNYPLTVVAVPNTQLSLRLDYDCHRFDDASIARMARHLQTLLAGIVANPDGRISQIPMLTKAERHQFLVEWNTTKSEYPQDKCIHQLFEEQVERTSDAIAVVFEGHELTYRELNAKANQLGHYLRSLGVGPEVLVGICVDRSLEMVVGILGILKAGGAYVPLDPAYPQERLVYMLNDSQASVLLIQQQLVDTLPEHKAQIVCLDTNWGVIGAQSEENLVSSAKASNLAYVIYTSGSTGKPKGVTISHRAICNHMFWMQTAFPLSEDDKVLQKTPFSFDASIWELYAPLLVGAQLVMARPGGHQDSAYLIEVITKLKVTTLKLVPSLLRMLLESEGFLKCKSLRHVFCGGEALSIDLIERFSEKLDAELHNLYGPTEATIDATFFTCKSKINQQIVPIGRPIANSQIYILDSHLQPVPIGVPGELHIGGACLARGYLNRSDLTAQKFIPNPFSNELGSRLYKTGDLARYLSDGNIEFLGRIDNQVKIRGFRIELGEIEAVLNQHPAVREAVVLAHENEHGDKRLVAYIVPSFYSALSTEHAALTSDLRRFLQQKLPEYMIPSAFVPLEVFPLTPNGKVSRQELLTLNLNESELNAKFVAPRSAAEKIVADIWKQVLGLNKIGIYDNFFELGGHSLLATQVIFKLHRIFQVVSLRHLFETPTIEGLVKVIEESWGGHEVVEQIAQTLIGVKQLSPDEVKKMLLNKLLMEKKGIDTLGMPTIPRRIQTSHCQLSFAQEQLWFINQLVSDTCAYNIPIPLRITGLLNVLALHQSLNEIVRRHEALRTTFRVADGQPVFAIAPELMLPLPVVDLRNLSETEREAEVLRLATKEAQQPFDLLRGPLLRITLLGLGEEDRVLLLTMHHIISDAWSIGVFIRELAVLYKAFSQGSRSPLPDLPIQYADFAVWQRQWLQGEVLAAQLAYWQQQLQEPLPMLQLPTDHPRPVVQSFRGTTQTFCLSAELTEALKVLSLQEGVTLFMTLLAAFQTLLHRYTKQKDIVIGTDVANRNRPETESIIGFFVNILVLRTDLSGNPSFRELLGRVRQVALGAYTHQELPFTKLVEALRPERKTGHTPLFQVLFVLQNTPMPALELPGLTLTPLEIDNKTAKFDLALFLTETESGLVGTWNYSTDLFDASTITRMSGHFQTLLASIVSQPDARLSNLEMLTEAENRQQAKSKQERQENKLKKFMKVEPKTVSSLHERLIKTEYLPSGKTLPLVFKPNFPDIDIIDCARNNQEFIETKLLHHGAILLRGFNLDSVSAFENLAGAICQELFGEYGDLPREAIGGKVYGSTPYPAGKTILFHNESSHMHCWPLKIWFFCVQPAQQGGETPIVDCRKVYQLLDPKLRSRFEQKQLMYVRNYTPGLDVSWQEFFHTKDKAVVENYCRLAATEFEWKQGDALRTRQVARAIAKHPKTGESVFFNQIQLHHLSCLEPAVRESLLSLFGEDNLPRNIYYGDGSQIENEVIQEILAVYPEATISFPWQQGDVLMLDNMLTAHGRNPYVGSRKIVVAMGEIFRSEDIDRKGMEAANVQ